MRCSIRYKLAFPVDVSSTGPSVCGIFALFLNYMVDIKTEEKPTRTVFDEPKPVRCDFGTAVYRYSTFRSGFRYRMF